MARKSFTDTQIKDVSVLFMYYKINIWNFSLWLPFGNIFFFIAFYKYDGSFIIYGLIGINAWDDKDI